GDLTCSVIDEFCTLDADYTFNIIAGGNFVTLTPVDARKGKFTLSFDRNPTAETRTVIVLVTSPCGEAHAFVYPQDGDDSKCGATLVAPKILGENTTDICAGGAVYLYLQGRPSGTYIWARNGVQVGTGTDYVATQAGIYIVYADKIGCTTIKPDTVHINALTTLAPEAPTVVAENNGSLCAPTDLLNLYAVFQGSGTVYWYKNGVRQALTGSPVSVGEGDWYAVLEDGGCSSVQSNTVNVALDVNPGAGTITPPTIKINDASTSGTATLCRGGAPTFEVVSPQSDVIYTWYRNNTSIGTGSTLTYSITSDASFVLRCRATAAAQCPKETDIVVSVSSTRPTTPSITCNTPGDAICDGSATLTANTSGTVTSYLWYRSDSENGTYTHIAGESNQHLVISQTGYYKVQTQDDICRSPLSAAKHISIASGVATATISGNTTNIHAGFSETYSASLNNPQGASYSWSVSGGATISGSATGSSAVLKFTAAGTATLTLTASNACGAATVTNNNFPITVGAACVTPSVNSYTPSSKAVSVVAGNVATLSINAAGSSTLSYQWYSNSANDNTTGTQISGETAAAYTISDKLAVGTHYFYCKVKTSCNGDETTSSVFTVTVKAVSTLPAGSGTLSGRTCFDVAQTNNSSDCGDLASRQAETLAKDGGRADFSNTITNTQTYTFTPVGTVSNVRFSYVEPSGYSGQIIKSITGGNTGNNITSTVSATVVYDGGLNSLASGKSASQAITVDIYAVYNDGATGGGADKTVKLTASIKDCYCCPGLLIPGGEYTENTPNIGVNQFPYAETDNTDGKVIESLRSYFTSTGKDLCIYYRDYSATANTNNSDTISGKTAINASTTTNANLSYVCGASNGKGVDTGHSNSAWRLPNLMELAQIGQLASENTLGPSAALTKAMVTASMSYTNGKLPAGSAITYHTFYNLRGDETTLDVYWSSTIYDENYFYIWEFVPSKRHSGAGYIGQNNGFYLRCVRSY
ncbi:MAG: hypothetical protein LBR64_05910, partial [Dysgonamonadaceae bacterium]|nr:hypothetical protein [Dysgonamonadaceae bacterium]